MHEIQLEIHMATWSQSGCCVLHQNTSVLLATSATSCSAKDAVYQQRVLSE